MGGASSGASLQTECQITTSVRIRDCRIAGTPLGAGSMFIGVGETDTDKMEFPALSLKEAIGAFTEAAYGERLTFEHA